MEKTDSNYNIGLIRFLLLVISLAILPYFSALSLNYELTKTIIAFVLYCFVIISGMIFTALLLLLPNSVPRINFGFSVVVKSVVSSFAFLFPFAVITIFSEALFKWNAIQGIFSSAIFTCVYLSASDLIKLGGKKFGNILVSLIASIVIITLYSFINIFFEFLSN